MNNETFTILEIQLTYNPKYHLYKDRKSVAKDAYKQFLLLLDQTQFTIKEEVAILFLNGGNRVIGGYKLSSGRIIGTVIDIRIILRIALKCLTSSIMIAHTHPSGELKPSKSDLEITNHLKKAAELLEIKLLDHLIITNETYYSIAKEAWS